MTIVVIAVNLYFVINQVEALNIEGGVLAVVCKYFMKYIFFLNMQNYLKLYFFLLGIFAILYLLFNLYLVIHMAACMGNKTLMNSRVSEKL